VLLDHSYKAIKVLLLLDHSYKAIKVLYSKYLQYILDCHFMNIVL